MDFQIQFHSSGATGVSSSRNYAKRAEAAKFLSERGFDSQVVPTMMEINQMQSWLRQQGLSRTDLYADNYVIAYKEDGGIVGVGKFHVAGHIVDMALQHNLKDVANNHIRKANFTQLFVDPEWRGQGIGGAIVARAVSDAREMGYLQMYGYADGDLAILRPFYQNHDFTFEESPQPKSIYGDIPAVIYNPREGGLFFHRSL